MEHEQLVAPDPPTSVGIIGLGPEVNNAIAERARQRTDGAIGNETSNEVVVIAVVNDFSADRGRVARLGEALIAWDGYSSSLGGD